MEEWLSCVANLAPSETPTSPLTELCQEVQDQDLQQM